MQRKENSRATVAAALALGLAAAPIFAGSPETDTSPANFECSPRVEELLSRGIAQSPSFERLVGQLESHAGVDLRFELRRQKPGKHAQSFLNIRGTYVREGDQMKKKVHRVTGQVVIPRVAYGDRQIELLAHELQHVLILLEGEIAHGSPEEEKAAIRFEQVVHEELESSV